MTFPLSRRSAIAGIGLGVSVAGLSEARAAPMPVDSLEPARSGVLKRFTAELASAPRRRDFRSVPMILDKRDLWDADALDLVIHYPGRAKQCWDNTNITGPWLNVMRNSLNAQIWSFGHPDFLCVSATHGTAQLALFDQIIWDKYRLANAAGGSFMHNQFIETPPAGEKDKSDYQAANGPFSPASNSIAVLQKRGAVFLACHNAIWELSSRLSTTANPDHLGVPEIAAELTNHLNEGVVLTPGVVATLVELQRAGFTYAT